MINIALKFVAHRQMPMSRISNNSQISSNFAPLYYKMQRRLLQNATGILLKNTSGVLL